MQTAERYHDISCGHRVAGHESKCAMLHGHNYRLHFTCRPGGHAAGLDSIGRVIDFSVMKATLCQWLEENWDHRFLAWQNDPVLTMIRDLIHAETDDTEWKLFSGSIVWVPFNPTAENMAAHLLTVVGPRLLQGSGVDLIKVRVEETRKCSAEASL